LTSAFSACPFWRARRSRRGGRLVAFPAALPAGAGRGGGPLRAAGGHGRHTIGIVPASLHRRDRRPDAQGGGRGRRGEAGGRHREDPGGKACGGVHGRGAGSRDRRGGQGPGPRVVPRPDRQRGGAVRKVPFVRAMGHSLEDAAVKAGRAAGVRERHEAVEACCRCFASTLGRMRSGEERQRGIPVGSGVVEGGCRPFGRRRKHSGTRGSARGANAMLALKSCAMTLRLRDFLDWRANQAMAA